MTNQDLLSQLPEPKAVWERFFEICDVPHGSGNMTGIRSFLENFAKAYANVSFKTDTVGNVLLTKAADAGCESHPAVAFQCHMDMVCESNDANRDFLTKGIECQIEEKDGVRVMTANDTTLGADDGIGIAAGLAILVDTTVKSGVIELLCTVDEETTMEGAENIDTGFFTAKHLVNIDSEDEGVVTLGSAGGFDVELTKTVPTAPVTNPLLKISVDGLCGGHSGVEIHKPLGNAIKLLLNVLSKILGLPGVQLASISGGKATNAIPRSAHAIISAPADQHDAIKAAAATVEDIVPHRYTAESNVSVTASLFTTEEKCVVTTPQWTNSIVEGLNAVPCGVLMMSGSISGLVETSCNLGNVAFGDGKLVAQALARSSSNPSMARLHAAIKAMGELYTLDVSDPQGQFSGWDPRPEDALAKLTVDAVRAVLGREPKTEAIHAGLECGLLMDKYPELQAVSVGATVKYPHCPDELLEIDTVAPFYQVMVEIVKRIAKC